MKTKRMPAHRSISISRRLLNLARIGVVVTLALAVGMIWSTGVLAFSSTDIPTPTSQSAPQFIATGPDGNLWFTEAAGGRVGRITPGGTITEFPVGASAVGAAPGGDPIGITAGPDGNLWFTEASANAIGRITPSGALTQFKTQFSDATQLFAITAGPDGNLWFTEAFLNTVDRITTDGQITRFPVPTQGSRPIGIAAGPDGGVWFVEQTANQIGRIDPNTGVFNEIPIPTAKSGGEFITAGPDGNLWFTEFSANQIGIITPQGTVFEQPIPTQGSGPTGITVGPDGAVWFAERTVDQLGRAVMALPAPADQSADQSTQGFSPAFVSISEFPVPAKGDDPIGITTGPDGNLWVAESAGSAITKFVPNAQQATADVSLSLSASPSPVATGTRLTYTVTVNNAGPATATGVVVKTAVPQGSSFASAAVVKGSAVIAPPGAGQVGPITAQLGSIPAKGSVEFQIVVNVLEAPGNQLVITGNVSTTATDPNPTNNSASLSTPIQGGAIVQLTWQQAPSTATNPTPAPTDLTVSLAGGVPGTADFSAPDAEVNPADTGCSLTAYNVYISSSLPVQTVPGNLWETVPAANTTTAPAAPSGDFYVVTTLWNCNGEVIESGGSNTASTCGGPTLTRLKVTGKIKVFGSGFLPDVEVSIGSVGFVKKPVLPSDPNAPQLVQKGALTNGLSISDATPSGASVIINFVQNGNCISSTSFIRP